MVIKSIHAQEVFNAQGAATIACSILLANNQEVTATIPSEFKPCNNSSFYKYDQNSRLLSKGMQEACNYINKAIAPMFVDKPLNFLAMDSELMDLDLSANKSKIGVNTMLAVSMALCKAQAVSENIALFELLQSLSGTKQVKVPQPITSIIQGRTHNTQPDVLEFLLLSQQDSFEKQMESVTTFQHHIKRFLKLRNQPTSIGQHGSFVPFILKMQEVFDLFKEVQKTVSFEYDFGLNISASDLYDDETKTYHWNNKTILSSDLVQSYQQLIEKNPNILYLQSAMADHDKDGWQLLTKNMLDTVIAADTTFCSNPMRIRKGILQGIGNMVIIRPEYIGTVSQTLAAIDACKKNDRAFMIATDLDQSTDTFAADLAVGTRAEYIKAGAVYSGEHISKYNRLLSIERYLQE